MVTPNPPPPAPNHLREVLELEQLDTNLFRSRANQVNVNRSLFGGQILGQGLKAASQTVVSDRACHSLHGYFLLPGASDIPVIYDVELTRDGGSFSTRRVVARQRSRPIFHMELSFHRQEAGLEHAESAPEVPDPDDLLDVRQLVEKFGKRLTTGGAAFVLHQSIIELKPVNAEAFLLREQPLARAQYWMRSASSLPDDPLMHQAGLAYLSDYFLVSTALMKHPSALNSQQIMVASLDHAMWFHSPPRADEWVLVDATSPFAGGARGLSRAELYGRDRKLIASVAQEGLIRLLEKSPRP